MKPSSYQSAAANLADEAFAALPAQAAAFTDPASAYEPAFVELCAASTDDLLFSIKQTLRKLRGFQVREFERRVKAVRLLSHSATAKPNGHAAVHNWKGLLIRSSTGTAKPILANAITALRFAPEWQGVLAFDEFANRATKLAKPPFTSAEGDWADVDDILTADWLQHAGIECGPSVAAAAVQAVSIERVFHPIRDYLTSLKWDSEPRISRWLTTYLGVTWSEYSSQVGSKWLISAVARIMRPGAKVDTCLILEGSQGRRKSSALAALFHPGWFSDQISADLAGKDSSQDLPGKWCFEFAEFDKLSKYDQGVIKSFIPRQVDHYRPSYGHRTVDIARQCVFCASTNKEAYLQDETGGRRWWPVSCGLIDLDAVERDRDQLWAEAFALFTDGTANGRPTPGLWWLIDETVIEASKAEQAERYECDAWDHIVWSWLQENERLETEAEDYRARVANRPPEPYFVHSDSIMELCLKKPVGNWTNAEKARVAKILKFHGFERFLRRMTTTDGEPILDAHGKQRREWYYRRELKS